MPGPEHGPAWPGPWAVRRQALVVRPRSDRFQVVAAARRDLAAVRAGLRELPVVVRDVDDTEVIDELALIDNRQRKDLTPFEEAEALHGLADRCGSTHGFRGLQNPGASSQRRPGLTRNPPV